MKVKINKDGGGYSFGPAIAGKIFPAKDYGNVVQVELPHSLTKDAGHTLEWAFLPFEVEVQDDN